MQKYQKHDSTKNFLLLSKCYVNINLAKILLKKRVILVLKVKNFKVSKTL